MASFFRASCFIFWLVWLLSFSFILGTLNFYDSHIVPDEQIELCMLLLRISCIVNICYAIFGCVFMKCDINHIICVFLYILPLAFVIPGISIWGVILTIGSHKSVIPSEKTLVNMYTDCYLEYKMFPSWLSLAEDELKCCGITGPQNYRDFFRSTSFPMSDCLTITYDIPCTCCKSPKSMKKISYLDSALLSPYECMTNVESKRCQDKTGMKNWTNHVFTTSKHPDRNLFTIDQKCDKSETEPFVLDPMMFNETLHLKGCYDGIGSLYTEMRSWLLIFFVILTGCPLMMLIVYLRSFCRSKPLSRHKSEHSLDIETVSALDIPVGLAGAGRP